MSFLKGGTMRFSVLAAFFFCALVNTTAQPAYATPLHGVILSPEGTPVAGAKIWAGALWVDSYSEKDGTIQRFTTDATGAFTVEVPDVPGKKTLAFVRVQSEKFSLLDTVVRVGDNKIKLSAPKTIRGVVKDEKGKPIADIPVRVIASLSSNAEDSVALNEGLMEDGMMGFLKLMDWVAALAPIETRSGADGKWSFDNLTSAIVMLHDERYAYAMGYAGIPGAPGGGEFVSLVAQPGAIVKGRVVSPEGTPLTGVRVTGANGIYGRPAATDAGGNFSLANLPPGPTVLMALGGQAKSIIPMMPLNKPLNSGEVREIGDWKATNGVTVTGILVDAKTGAVIPGVKVGGLFGKPAITGADGRFSVQMDAKQPMLSIMHTGYARYFKPLDKVTGTTYDAGRITLEPALSLTGQLVDEADAPVKNVMLIVMTRRDNFPSADAAQSDVDGKFKVNVPVGAATLQLQNEEWEIVGGAQMKITVTENNAPIKVKVRKMAVQKVEGRVVTPGGKPIQGVTVVLQATRASTGDELGDVISVVNPQKNADTDAQGRFSLEVTGATKSVTVRSVEGNAYLMRKTGTGKLQNGVWAISDTIVAELTGQVKGRVLDLKGAPVAGALVTTPEVIEYTPVKSDAAGNFLLTKLPEGEAVVLAAHDRNFARGTAKNGQVELLVSPPGVIVAPMRHQLFEQIVKKNPDGLSRYWHVLGIETMLAIGLQSDGALTPGDFTLTNADWNKAARSTLNILEQSATKAPDWLRQNGSALLAKIPQDEKISDQRFETEYALAAALAFGSEAERTTAKQWLDFASKAKDKPNDTNANARRWFFLAGLAGALDDPRANNFALSALTMAEAAGKKSILDNASTWGRFLGLGGARMLSLLDAEWPLEARVKAWSSAVQTLAPYDDKGARALLGRLEELDKETTPNPAPGAAPPPPLPADEAGTVNNIVSFLLTRQAKSDPAGALEGAEKLKRFDWRLRTAIARGAMGRKDYVLAARVMRPALELPGQPLSELAEFAALSEAFDKDLAAKFWAKAQASIKPVMGQYYDYSSVGEYAFFRAPYDPAPERLRLEALWLQARPNPANPANTPGALLGGDQSYLWSSAMLAAAMMPYDGGRAIEMMAELPENYSKDARARIAAYLLANEADRALLHPEN